MEYYDLEARVKKDTPFANATGNEGIEWISSSITASGEKRNYFIPRFSRILDVLDENLTTYSVRRDFVVNPWFSKVKVAQLALFHGRPDSGEITPDLVVNELLMKALEKAKLAGIGFTPARSS